MPGPTLTLKLTGRATDLQLPALLVSATRSTGPAADPFLPDGYLEPTSSFDVGAAARGGDEDHTQQQRVAQANEIVVLELADGSTLITSAGRLQTTLETTRPELLGPDGELLLEKLRAVGASPQRGPGEAVGGLISKVYTLIAGAAPDAIIDDALGRLKNPLELGVSWAGTKALMWAVERRIAQTPGLYAWHAGSGTAAEIDPVNWVAPEAAPAPGDKPMLVFVHGTGSNTLGSFGDLRAADRELWAALCKQFEGGVYAFEHRTLSEGPIENAIQLAQALPVGANVSFVSHSRGGLVVDLLCLAGFDAQIDRYAYELAGIGDADPAENARVIGELKDAHAAQRAQLRQLATLLRERRLNVQRYVRAASPANGTKLASGNFDVFLSGLLTLIGQVPYFFGNPIYSAFKRVVIEIAKNRTNAHLVPGIEAMLPDSPMARLLREAPVREALGMAVIAGDIQGGHLLKRLGVLLTDFLLFDNEDNDLVVNTTAMLAGIAPKAGARVLFDRGSEVSHFRYFTNTDTRNALRDWLIAPDLAKLELFQPLPSADEYAAAMATATAANRDAAAAGLPVVVVLPGVMGSHLQVDGGDRVWFDPLDIASGGLEKIAWGQSGVEAEELFGMSYGKLCAELSRTHRVERFAYDWRQPLDVLADRLGEFLDRLQKDTEQPIRLLAHSMGGLVVRACIHKRRSVMDAVMGRVGARLVMLGTPNQGAHSMVENLIGKGDTLRTLVRLDLKHDMQEVLDIVGGFRGALQLLPKPGFVDMFQGLPDGGGFFDFQSAQTWVAFKDKVRDFWFGDMKCSTPSQQTLDSAAWLWQQDGPALPQLPAGYASKTVYVFGVARNTPCGMREEGGRLKMVGTTRGDGTVSWESGRMVGIGSYYYMPAEHGDLPSTVEYFPALLDLLANGSTGGLSLSPPALRDAEEPAPFSYDAGPPTIDDPDALQRGLMGGSIGRRVARPPKHRLEVTVKAMDLRWVSQPILVGQYEQDPIAGPQALIDRDLLSGALSERYNLGIYAGPVGTATVVLTGLDERRAGRPSLSGAVITGLGKYDGSLSPATLTDAIRTGTLRYLLQVSDVLGDTQREVALASLLIGYNSAANLTVGTSVEALVRGVLEANAKFAEITRKSIRVNQLHLVEIYLDTAISAAYALGQAAEKLRPLAARQGTLLVCKTELEQNQSVRRRLFDGQRDTYWPRLMITDAGNHDDAGSLDRRLAAVSAGEGDARDPGAAAVTAIGERLRFLYVGQRARAESVIQQRQPGLIETLVRHQIRDPRWDESFGRMLFQLMVPHDFKDAARQLDRVVLVVDGYTANLPWELMLAADAVPANGSGPRSQARPLALSAAVVRQFASTTFRRQVRQSPTRSALVIGDPSVAGFDTAFVDAQGQRMGLPPQLPGAKAEAEAVATVLGNLGYTVTKRISSDNTAAVVLGALYQQPWRVLHISAHGVFNQRHVDGSYRSGVVLSDGLLITAAEIDAMEVVPDLVFLNCCHLAKVDVGGRANRLAASVARELIEIGVRCVIVAGWAVNDAIARVFGEVFYRELLFGQRPFGLAVYAAREAAWDEGKGQDITWGAFQAYGDPGWLADPRADRSERTDTPQMFVSLDEARQELTRRSTDLLRRGETLSVKRVLECVADADKLVAERCPPGWRRHPELLMALGDYFLQLGHLGRAYEAIVTAVHAETRAGDVPIRALEQLAEIEVQLGDWRAEDGIEDNLEKWIKAGESSIELALRRLDTLEGLANLQDGSLVPESAVVSVERNALRGSAWKRKASLHARQLLRPGIGAAAADAAGRKMVEALGHSIAAYRRAEGHPISSEFKPDLALNRLSLDALTDWSSPAAREVAIALAQQCRQIGFARAAEADDIWDALMPSDALLAERLIDGSLGRADDAGTGFFEELAAAYAQSFAIVAAKPVEIQRVVRDLEILSRFCDALALVRHDDAALYLTADRLLELVQRIQPRRPPRLDRPPRPGAQTPRPKPAPGKSVAKKAAAKKLAAGPGRKR